MSEISDNEAPTPGPGPLESESDDNTEAMANEILNLVNDDSNAESNTDTDDARSTHTEFVGGIGIKRKVKDEPDDSGSEKSDGLVDSDRLDDDDYELLEENTGVKYKRKKKFKRVRRFSSSSSESEIDIDEVDNRRGPRSREIQLSSEDDDDENQGNAHKSDQETIDDDNFVVDAQGNPVSLYAGAREVITDAKVQDYVDVFGEEFEGLENENESSGPGDEDESDSEYDSDDSSVVRPRKSKKKKSKTTVKKPLEEIFEPIELEAAGITKVAERVKCADMPERFVLRSYPIRSLDEEDGDELEAELEAEGKWIYGRAFVNTTDIEYRATIQGIIQTIIKFIRVRCFEVPYIIRYRRQAYEPYLEKEDIWKIYELDQDFCKLVDRQKRLGAAFLKMKSFLDVSDDMRSMIDVNRAIRPITDNDFKNVENVQTQLEAQDLQGMFHLHYSDYATKIKELLRSRKEDIAAQEIEDLDEFGGPEYVERTIEETIAEIGVVGEGNGTRVRKDTNAGAYRCCSVNGIGSFIQNVGLTSDEYGENVRLEFKIHEPKINEEELDVVASQFTSLKFQTIDEVKTAGKFMLAKQISKDFNVKKFIRQHLSLNAKVSVCPTAKGYRDIEETHVLFPMKYLKEKPITDLNPIQFFELHNGEKEKLVELKIKAPLTGDGKPIIDCLVELLQSERDDVSDEREKIWNKYRSDIIIHAYETFILPDCINDLRRSILQEAQNQIKDLCVQKLQTAIQVAPFGVTEMDDPDYFEEQEIPEEDENYDEPVPSRIRKKLLVKKDIKVMALAYSGDTQYETIFYAVLSPKGEVEEPGKLDCLLLRERSAQGTKYQEELKKKSFAKLRYLIREHSPDLIVISSESILARRLFNELEKLVNDLKDEIEDEFEKEITIHIHDNEMSKVASKSKFYQDEFPDYGEILKEAISLGRLMLDPLLEYSQLYNKFEDILCVHFHKYQDTVSKEVLLAALERAFMDVTMGVAVDINDAIKYPHRAGTLQFVSGLGFYRSLQIRQAFKSANKSMIGRNELVTYCKLKPIVFINAAGFIRIESSLFDEELSQLEERGQYVELFDTTEIHPENYQNAMFLCKTILIDLGLRPDESDDDMFGVAEPFLRKTEINEDALRALREIDMHDFNRQLMELETGTYQGQNLLCSWIDIRRAILCHKADLRMKYMPYNERQLFFVITKLDENEFYVPGKLQVGRVIGFVEEDNRKPDENDNDRNRRYEDPEPVPLQDSKTGEVICPYCDIRMKPFEYDSHWNNSDCQQNAKAKAVKISFDNGLYGKIYKRDFSDEDVGCKLKTRVIINQPVTVRVMDIQYEHFTSKCSSKSSDLNSLVFMPKRDEYFDWEAETQTNERYEDARKKQIAKNGFKNSGRKIDHHSFKNWNHEQVMKELEGADSGELIFRPSTRGFNWIKVSWKVTGNIIQHFDIEEKEKDPNDKATLGKKLCLGDIEFEDLDNITTDLINPLAGWVRDLIKFRYYNPDPQYENEEFAFKQLNSLKDKNGRKIHYVISPSKTYPGAFVLSYLPNDKVYQEIIRLTPDGYIYRKHLFKDVDSFVIYFKENFNMVPVMGPPLQPSTSNGNHPKPNSKNVVAKSVVFSNTDPEIPSPAFSVFSDAGTENDRPRIPEFLEQDDVLPSAPFSMSTDAGTIGMSNTQRPAPLFLEEADETPLYGNEIEDVGINIETESGDKNEDDDFDDLLGLGSGPSGALELETDVPMD